MEVFHLVMTVPVFSIPLSYSNHTGMRPESFVPLALMTAVVVLLVAGCEAIARMIVPEQGGAAIFNSLAFGECLAVFFSAIGVSTFFWGLQSLSGVAFHAPGFGKVSGYLVSGLIQMILGGFLFLQARGLANLWRYFQEKRVLGPSADEERA